MTDNLFDGLSDEAKAVAGSWFGAMAPGKGNLTFQLAENKPTPTAEAALAELVRVGIISVEPFNEFGGLVYRPIVSCLSAFIWASKNRDNPAMKLQLAQPITSKKDARAAQKRGLAA